MLLDPPRTRQKLGVLQVSFGEEVARAAKRAKLSRSDWLASSMDALLLEGVEGIHVEPLARRLGVTKGSFYWHFKDRQELLSDVIEYWTTRMVDAVRAHETLTGSASERLLQVMEEITRQDRGRYEAAMRMWASSDEHVAKAVKRVDEARLKWTSDLFLEMGFAREQAEIRGRMMVFYEYGEAEFSIKAPVEKRLEYVRLRHAILTAGATEE